jgi:hypothetical protein
MSIVMVRAEVLRSVKRVGVSFGGGTASFGLCSVASTGRLLGPGLLRALFVRALLRQCEVAFGKGSRNFFDRNLLFLGQVGVCWRYRKVRYSTECGECAAYLVLGAALKQLHDGFQLLKNLALGAALKQLRDGFQLSKNLALEAARKQLHDDTDGFQLPKNPALVAARKQLYGACVKSVRLHARWSGQEPPRLEFIQ